MVMDWGHGPKIPIRMFTEEEVRKVFDSHTPIASVEYEEQGPEVFCDQCSGPKETPMFHWHKEPWNIDHVIQALKEVRDGRQTSESASPR